MKPSSDSDNIASKILLQGIHMELTPALQDVLRDKLSGLLRRNPFILRINLRLQLNQTLGQKPIYRASARIEISGPDLNASAEGPECYDVIDELVAKLTQLLERRHGLRKDRRNHPHEIELGAGIPKAAPPVDDET